MKQKIQQSLLIVVDQLIQIVGNREHKMMVGHPVNDFGPALSDPLFTAKKATAGAVRVAAGSRCKRNFSAVRADGDNITQISRAALCHETENLHLFGRHFLSVLCQIVWEKSPEDLADSIS